LTVILYLLATFIKSVNKIGYKSTTNLRWSAGSEIVSFSQKQVTSSKMLSAGFSLTLLLFISISSFAQQTVRGKVIDSDSKQPIAFAGITLLQTSPILGTTSNINGNFVLQNVPIGTHSFSISSIGYENKVISNLKVTAGKEAILLVELLQVNKELEEVIVIAKNRERTVNSMASVSAKSLNMEEANRYAGSFGDPARQVLNFAGGTL